jgi:hypothetical protein
VLVTHQYKLDDIVAAYDLFAHQRDGVLKVAIKPAHHHAHGVIEEHAFTNLGPGVDFNAREPARKVRDEAPQPFQPVAPAPVRRPVQPHGVQAGVTGDDLHG